MPHLHKRFLDADESCKILLHQQIAPTKLTPKFHNLYLLSFLQSDISFRCLGLSRKSMYLVYFRAKILFVIAAIE